MVILVVDEDATLRAAIESALTRQFPDVAIRTAENGVAAWEIARSGAVDLLISGIMIAEVWTVSSSSAACGRTAGSRTCTSC